MDRYTTEETTSAIEATENLDVAEYNAILEAYSTDPEVRERIEERLQRTR